MDRTTSDKQTPSFTTRPDEIAFLEEMHKTIFGWYAQAETKAQIILGFTGVFLSLIVGAVLLAPSGELPVRYPAAVLWLAVLCYGLSIVLAVAAIWSRGVFRNNRRDIVFFGAMANYRNSTELKEAIQAILNTEAYLDELGANTLIFAQNTRLKHRLVNMAAVFSGLGLIITLVLALIAVGLIP